LNLSIRRIPSGWQTKYPAPELPKFAGCTQARLQTVSLSLSNAKYTVRWQNLLGGAVVTKPHADGIRPAARLAGGGSVNSIEAGGFPAKLMRYPEKWPR
jgi:hypothetical protein